MSSVSQLPGRGPAPDPGINYTGPREVLLEFVILVFNQFSLINVLYWKYSEENDIRECVEKLRPRCWPEETTICYKISLVQ